MKKTALLPLLAALTACTAGTPGMSVGIGLGTNIGSHLGLGTSLNIPVSLSPGKTALGSNSQTAPAANEIIAYFDVHGTPSNAAVKGGFYRQLISKRGDEYIVQDFYGDQGRKRTDPYTISRNQLMNFNATPDNGSLTRYAYNGAVMQQQVFQNGRLISAQY
ncbi:NemA protein [Neisseria sp. ZJ106]|uniref:NemA protein n=1 Tax=Neisseria lisongii TaxID=2912188 RepID=A0ABY7RHA5_9NEIS|nr:NemA protein [Neisseria lisongii]MCF7520817.1 NemA protein [Neisseria lisongii]WCL70753.1 NemA protein [Neisseria lisongii]